MVNNTPEPISDWPDTVARVINAVVVILIVGLVVLVFWQLTALDGLKTELLGLLKDPNSHNVETARTELLALTSSSQSMFGSLTTFIGTALGAYFGISVSASTAKSAVNAVSASAQQTAATSQQLGSTTQQLSTTQQQLGTTQQQLTTAQKQIAAASDVFSTIAPADQTHEEQFAKIRAILSDQ